jgi:hypothetical protein
MLHKFAIGTAVYYDSGFLSDASRGVYKITKHLLVERNKLPICDRFRAFAPQTRRAAG